MALELSTLAFKVETTELDAAAKKLGVLQEAVQKLNTVRKGSAAVDKEATKAAVDLAKVTEAQAKADAAAAKAIEAKAKASKAEVQLVKEQAKGSATRVKELDNEVQATKRANSASLEYQKIKNEFMTKGLSSGEASTMTVARLNNVGDAIENLIEKELKFRRTISGSNPFDNSLSGMDKLIIQHRELVEAIKQSDNRAGLSMKQAQELSRDKERTIALMKNEGANHAQITAALKDQEQAYISSAKEVNNRQAILKEKLRTERESANAVRAVAVEEERMKSIVTQLTGAENQHMSVTEKAAIAQANYARNLKRAGIEGDEAAKRLRAYSEQQKVVNAVEEKRQAQYLQRGLQPQIGDVAVSLAAGQNPLTVLLQQGDQIRGLIAQTGVSGELLRKTMQNAMTETVKSIGQTAAAMSSVLGGAISSVGKAMLTVAGAPLTLLSGGFATTGVAAEVAAANMLKLEQAAKLLTKVGLVAVIVAISAALYEMYQGMKQHDDLVRQINLTGASLGMTADEAALFAKNISAAGDSGTKMLGVISAMAKEGGFTRDEIKLVGDAALDLYKYGGVAIEDTVKAFSKLKDDPVKALIELAKATGDVSPEVIQAVYNLEQMGDKAGAVALAMQAMTKANKDTVKDMKDDFTGLATFLKELGTDIGKFYDGVVKGIRNLWVKDSPAMALQSQIDNFRSMIADSEKNGGGVWTTSQGLLTLKEAKEQLALMQKRQHFLREQAESEQIRRDAEAATTRQLEKQLDIETKLFNNDQKRAKALREAVETGQPLVAKGLRTQDQQNDVYARIRKQHEEKPQKKDKELTKLERAREVYKDLVNVSEGLSSSYNEEKAALDLLVNSKDKAFKITQAEYVLALDNLKNKQPEHIKLLKAQAKEQQELTKVQNEYLKSVQELNDYKLTTDIENQQLDYRLAVLGQTEEQVRKLNKQLAVEVSLAKAKAAYDKDKSQILGMGLSSEQADKLLGERLEAYDQRVRQINRELAVSAAEDYAREFKAVMDTISEGIAEALLEGGDVGARKLRDNIVKVLRQKIVLQIDAVINPILNAAGKSISDSLGLGQSGGGVISDVFNAVSTGKSISDAISSGFTAMGSATAQQFANFATSSAGQSLRLSTLQATGPGATAVPTMTTSTSALASSMGPMVAAAASAIAGYGAYTGISGNKSINPTLDAIGKVASLFGPLYGVIGGLANRAFGMGPKEVRESGIQGSFGADTGANLKSYARWTKDSGWFNNGDEGVDITALDKKITDPFNTAIIGIASQTKAFAGILGLDAGRIAGFTKNIKLQLDNLKPEDQQKAIDEAIQSFGSGMAEILLGSLTEVTRQVGRGGEYETETVQVYSASKYTKEGETSFQTLARLAGSLTAVNSVFDMLNTTLMDASIVGADAASKLIDAFGGLEQFGAALGGFYENFYTEQEKSIETTASLKKQFAALGVTMPVVDDSMRSWYKTQVLSALQLDQSVVANATYTASLIALQATVNEVAPAFGELNAVIRDSKDIIAERAALQDELNQLTMTEAQLYDLKKAKIDQSNHDVLESIRVAELQRSINAEAKGLQDELNQLTLSEVQLNDLKRDSLYAGNQALFDSVQAAKAANAAVAAFNSSMQGLGNTRFDLENQLLSAQGKDPEVQQRTRARDLAELTKGLSETDALVVTQAYDYNEGLKQQIKTQQEANEAAQRAAEATANAAQQAADNAAQAASQIKQAWQSITDSLFNEIARIKGLLVGDGSVGFANAQQQFSSASLLARAGDQDAAKSLPELSQLVLSLAEGQATTLTELRRIQGRTAASLTQTATGLSGQYGLQVPAYASGGSYNGGLALVGEQGPEIINFRQAGQVYNAGQTAEMLTNSNSTLAAKLDTLNNEVAMLRFETRATASNTSKLNANFERSIVPTSSGDALLVKTA